MTLLMVPRKSITLVAVSIMVAVVVLAGLMFFQVMKHNTEALLRSSLQSSLHARVDLTYWEIRQASDRIAALANRPHLTGMMLPASAGQGAAVLDTETGRMAVDSMLQTGVSAVAVFDSGGRQLATGGTFAQAPDLSVSLQMPGSPTLLWQDGLLLRRTVELRSDGQLVGSLAAEQRLPASTESFQAASRLGSTGDQLLCARDGTNMRCFPATLRPVAVSLPMRSPAGVPLPVAHALEGRTGFIAAKDYRGKAVVAAFSPVQDLGLGMVLKVDSAELYAPIWRQLRDLLLLMGAVLLLAVLLLRWQLTPLVSGLARSERAARLALEQLHESESRVKEVVENVDDGIVTISIAGVIELFNPGAERMFGYRRDQVIGKNVSLLMPEPHHSEHDSYLERYQRTGERRVIGITRQVVARRSNGECFPMEIRTSEVQMESHRQFIGIMHDITERKAAEEKIAHMAHYDLLTDLPNRRLVQHRIEQTVASARRAGSVFAVLFIDLDKFKSINDTFGHDVGDKLLCQVAGRLTTTLRADDTVGRQGGDEFIALLSILAVAEDAAVAARKVLAALSVPFSIDNHTVHSGASIGIAIYPKDGSDVETLLKNSDTAMYQAKATGRGNFRYFSPEMDKGT